jgi:hypothetical protein
MRNLEPDERQDIAATIAQALAEIGRRTILDGAVRLSDEQAQPCGPQDHLRP